MNGSVYLNGRLSSENQVVTAPMIAAVTATYAKAPTEPRRNE